MGHVADMIKALTLKEKMPVTSGDISSVSKDVLTLSLHCEPTVDDLTRRIVGILTPQRLGTVSLSHLNVGVSNLDIR